MLVLILSALLQISHADTLNPLIKAIAIGCGDKVYSKVIDTPEIDEVAQCYQTGLDELPRKRLPAIELGFQVCDNFHIDLQKFVCLDRFKDEAHDPNLYKIFNDCNSPEKDLRKKYLATFDCLKKKKADYPQEKSTEVMLSTTEINYLKTTNIGCGMGRGISSTFIEKKEVEGLTDCYQTALLGLEKTLPNTAQLTLELCDNFTHDVQKVECVKRIADENKKPEMKYLVSKCLSTQRTNDVIKKGHTTKSHTFKNADVFYQKRYNCIKDNLQSLAKLPEQDEAPKSTPAAGAARP